MALAVILVLTVGSGWRLPPASQIASSATFLVSLQDQHVSWHLVAARLAGHQGFWVKPAPIASPHFHSFANGFGVLWSLSVQELFYLLWAPIVLRASRRAVVVACIAPLFVCPILRAFVLTTSF